MLTRVQGLVPAAVVARLVVVQAVVRVVVVVVGGRVGQVVVKMRPRRSQAPVVGSTNKQPNESPNNHSIIDLSTQC